MAFVKYQHPVAGISQLHDELANLFNSPLMNSQSSAKASALNDKWRPSVDVTENPEQYQVLVDVPGVDPKDIKVSIEQNQLIIQGERNEKKITDNDDLHLEERFTGSFYRQFTLPKQIDAEAIAATCKNGVLKIKVPKREVAASRFINVNSED